MKQMFERKLYIIWFVLTCSCLPAFSSVINLGEDDTYNTETRMFHIERSKNRNIVCYDLNLDAMNYPDKESPLSVYWINREEHPGRHGTMSYIQQKLAYGYAVVGKQNGVITIVLNAVKNRKITIEQNNNKYICRMDISNQSSALSKVYVKTKASNSLQVEYVDIQGYSLETGIVVTERIIP